MYRKINLAFFFTILLMTLAFPLVGNASAIKEDNSYSILFKNATKAQEFLKEINKEYVESEIIPEIGLVTITSDYDLKELVHDKASHLKDDIISQGSLPKFNDTEMHLNEVSINSVKKEDYPNYKDRIKAVKPLTYFEPFNWYLKDVTNNFSATKINDGEGVKIAILDSGIDINHPLLSHNVNPESGKNYTSDNSADIFDQLGHGTSVAGIITALAPQSKITPYKVINEDGGESYWVIQAIIDAVKHGNDVINISLGTYKDRDNEQDEILIDSYRLAINYAKRHDTIVVASAGNDLSNLDDLLRNENSMYLPAGLKEVISVSSNNKEDEITTYSNSGNSIDFSAPGGDLGEDFDITDMIISTFPLYIKNTEIDQLLGVPQGYTISYGTSLAAPQVSATAALIISEYKQIYHKKPSIKKVENYLKHGSVDIGIRGRDTYFGFGKVNAYQSLKKLTK
jgi:lantibiotic leader peptide-processing serine protease